MSTDEPSAVSPGPQLTPPMPDDPTRAERRAERQRLREVRRDRRRMAKQRGVAKKKRDPKGKRKKGKK